MADVNDKNDSGEKKQPAGSRCCLMEIRVKGQLIDQWRDWFDNMELRMLENGEMIISRPISDQAALMGILNKLNRLNLKLLSFNEVSQTKSDIEKEKKWIT